MQAGLVQFSSYPNFSRSRQLQFNMPGQLKEFDPIPSIPITEWKGQEPRVSSLQTHFTNYFGHQPSFFVRVPGRVNLIGEHVDYCGYGVFPMAIEQDVLIACHILSDPNGRAKINLINVANEYGHFECFLKDMRELLKNREQGVSPPWYLYFLCGVLGIVEHLGFEENEGSVSIQVCVDGRVPPRAGLSSSSALVCAAALTTLVANKGEMDRKEIASLCASSERYIGTQGGGMDQAIAFLASSGTAQRIEFIPELKGEKVQLPSCSVFVIANSLVEANKAASDGYNVRVAECRLSTWILAKRQGLRFLELDKIKHLQTALGFNFKQMLDLVEQNVHKEPYTAFEVAQLLDLEVTDLVKMPLMNRIPLKSLSLRLYQRVTHVLQEASRVEEFHKVCVDGNNKKETLVQLGQLMNQSHQSLKDLYECSHPKLDQLVSIGQRACYGARLTGAGWGGCMVVLADAEQLPLLLETLKVEYYHGIDMSPHVFVSQPGAGASILLQ